MMVRGVAGEPPLDAVPIVRLGAARVQRSTQDAHADAAIIHSPCTPPSVATRRVRRGLKKRFAGVGAGGR